MTVSITGSALSTSSKTLTFEEGSASIVAKTGQKFLTDKFVTCSTYVFKRGTKIPVAYLIMRRTSGSNSTCVFNTSTGAVSSITNGTAEVVLPDYFARISSAMRDSDVTPTYYMSACVSQLGATSSAGTTEKSYFSTNFAFNKSAYSTSNKPPIVRTSDEKIPNTSNGYANGSMSGANIQFGVSSGNYTYISLMVSL